MGLSIQISVMCLCRRPRLRSSGETKAVSAAYENSIPITAAEILASSSRVLGL